MRSRTIILGMLMAVALGGCAALKPYLDVLPVPDWLNPPSVERQPSVEVPELMLTKARPLPKNAAALSTAMPYRPLLDYRLISIVLEDEDAFAWLREVRDTPNGPRLVPIRQANQVECNIGQQSQMLATIELANYLETLPGGADGAETIDGCLQTIFPRLNVDYRVRELLPRGISETIGSPLNLQDSKNTGWECFEWARFYRCPRSVAKKARDFLTNSKNRKLCGTTITKKLADFLDMSIQNGQCGSFCVGGSKPGTYCTSDGACSGGKCRGTGLEVVAPSVPFDKNRFRSEGRMSSNHFIEKPDANQLALLDEVEYRHLYGSARVCDPSLPPGLSAQEAHRALEASAKSLEQLALFTIDPFMGQIDQDWSPEDRKVWAAIFHLAGHHSWGESVKAGDQGAAGMHSIFHQNDHNCAMRKSDNFEIRPFPCVKTKGNGLVNYESCPNFTCADRLAEFKKQHPNPCGEIMEMLHEFKRPIAIEAMGR